MMDKVGNKSAAAEIAMIKVQAPNMALKIIDDAIQAHGGGGVSEDFGLAKAYAHQRTLRLADGPDEVHERAIARIEFANHSEESETGSSSGDVGAWRLGIFPACAERVEAPAFCKEDAPFDRPGASGTRG